MGYSNIKKQKKLFFFFKLRILIFQCPGTTHITNFTRMPLQCVSTVPFFGDHSTIVTEILIAAFLLLFSMPFVCLVFLSGAFICAFLSSSIWKVISIQVLIMIIEWQGFLLSIHWTAKNRLSFYYCTRNNCAYLTMHKRQMTKEWGGKEESSLELVVAPVMAPRRPCVTRCHRQNAAHTPQKRERFYKHEAENQNLK